MLMSEGGHFKAMQLGLMRQGQSEWNFEGMQASLFLLFYFLFDIFSFYKYIQEMQC